MPVTKTQLLGGAFQDSEGNLLANGTLKFRLSQDASITGIGNIASGIEIVIQLDSAGNVASSSSTPPASNQFMWANDVMSPVNTFYRVTGYNSLGQPCWGMNNQQITSGGIGGGTFNLGSWTPNTVLSWTPAVQPLLLENNGTKNSSQTVLNVESTDASVTITDVGGGTLNFQVASSGVPAGTNVIPLPPGNSPFPGITTHTVNTTGATKSIVQYIPGNSLLCQPTKWKITLQTTSSSTTITAVLVKCTAGTGTVLSTTPVTFGGISSPTLSPAGFYTSDSISLTLSSQFDYFLILNTSTGLMLVVDNTMGVGGSYIEPSDFTSTSPITFTGGSQEYGKFLTFGFQSA